MKKVIIIFLVPLITSIHMFARTEKINYRGWTDCYRISNKHCEIVIGASSGGRVLKFSLDGKNIIYENPSQNGKLLQDWILNDFDPDGGRFDYGPELVTRNIHSLTWMGTWTAKISGEYSVVLTGSDDDSLGIQSTREFIMSPDSALVTIRQTAKNISKEPLMRHFWGRTLVIPEGFLFMPINPKSRFKHGWGRFVREPNRVNPNPAEDDRITISKDILRFHATGSTLKGGTDASAGWQAYKSGDLVFMKKFTVLPANDYSGSDHMTGVFYSNGKFCELEPCSQTFLIKPSEIVEFEERWELFTGHKDWSP